MAQLGHLGRLGERTESICNSPDRTVHVTAGVNPAVDRQKDSTGHRAFVGAQLRRLHPHSMAKKGKGGKGGKGGKAGGKKKKAAPLKPGERDPTKPLVIGARMLLKYCNTGDDQKLVRDLLAPLLPADPDEAEAGIRLDAQGIDAVDEEYGWSMLMWAARAGYKRHVEALLAAGANPSLSSSSDYWINGHSFPEGSTALDIARSAGKQALPVVQLLEEEMAAELGGNDDPMNWTLRPMTPNMSSRGAAMFGATPMVRTPFDHRIRAK